MKLETSRLILRPWTLEDLPAFEWISNDPDVADFTSSFVYPQPEGWARERLERQIEAPGTWGHSFAVIWRETNEIIAEVSIGLELKRSRGELGYMCARDWRGRGIVPEAVRALTTWAFTNLELNRIQACHFPRNPTSGRVLEKAGLHREGVLRGYILKNGVSEDVIIYGITRADFTEKEPRIPSSLRLLV
jgi:[ribosomal protein S5]-alanine N-acetyltransferase